MDKYAVIYTPNFKIQFKEIIHYISYQLSNPQAANRLLNLSQAMFAALMKVSNKTVEKWEQGANPVTNGNAIAMVLFNKYPSLVETLIEVKDEIVEPDFSKEIVKEEIPQGLKLAKTKWK